MIAKYSRDQKHGIEGRIDYLLNVSERLPWLERIVFWLMENSPPDCAPPSICHGDFHPYNLLAKNGEVTAILDWSACRICDPAMDVASTLVIFNAATKHIIPSFNSKIETQKYLDAYRGERYLTEQNLGYYQILGCIIRLSVGGFIWTQPTIQNELVNIIYEFSKIHVEVPR